MIHNWICLIISTSYLSIGEGLLTVNAKSTLSLDNKSSATKSNAADCSIWILGYILIKSRNKVKDKVSAVCIETATLIGYESFFDILSIFCIPLW